MIAEQERRGQKATHPFARYDRARIVDERKLFLGEFEVSLGRSVIPRTCHGTTGHLAVDDVMDSGAASWRLGIRFHMHRAGGGIKRSLGKGYIRSLRGSGVDGSRQGFAIPLQIDGNIIAIIRVRAPIPCPCPAQRIAASLSQRRKRDRQAGQQADPAQQSWLHS